VNALSDLASVTQKDPFKLIILSKGRQNAAVSNANFFFGLDGQPSFIGAGEDGVLRALEFLPHCKVYNSGTWTGAYCPPRMLLLTMESDTED